MYETSANSVTQYIFSSVITPDKFQLKNVTKWPSPDPAPPSLTKKINN
jgi:hypothetical protein